MDLFLYDGVRTKFGSPRRSLRRRQTGNLGRGCADNPGLRGSAQAGAITRPYAFGLAQNHGFTDGNKLTAWVVARLFLADNGHDLRFDKADAIGAVEALAAGRLSEAGLADWFRDRLVTALPSNPPTPG